MKTRCMIVDDEPLAIEVIAAHVGRLDTLQLEARCTSAEEALSVLQQQDIDLLFLDIKMPGMSGLALLRSLRHPPTVIITTAHRDYALEGYDLDVLDYLLKPISFERFVRAVQKYHASRPRSASVVQKQEETGGEGHILLRADRKVHKVQLEDILFIESLKDYVRVRLANRSITTRMTIGALEEMLPPSRFLRIHRSCIVAVDKIDAFTSHSVEIGTHELTIGRYYRHAVLQALQADPDTA
ncbi:MAG: DNA-binding response regulator [Ignavibacteria bacterium]|nr:MAG: DNA-binding response regulator [Ignavibacteria bacterium]